ESVTDINGEILLVSQFTLYANIKKGTKPDFHGSAAPDIARPFYDKFVELVKSSYAPERVKDGAFGAMMQVALVNDGPVTFEFDTAKSGNVAEQKGKDDKKKQWEEKKKATQGKKQPSKASKGEGTNNADKPPAAPANGAGESTAAPATEAPLEGK